MSKMNFGFLICLLYFPVVTSVKVTKTPITSMSQKRQSVSKKKFKLSSSTFSNFGPTPTTLLDHVSSPLAKAVKIVSMSIFQTILRIPVWIGTLTEMTIDFITLMLKETKEVTLYFYNDILIKLDKIIDNTPFLIRYQEDGKEKIALTPKAQLVLYVISTVYAAQAELSWRVDSRRKNTSKGNKNMIQHVRTNIQTRFFPSQTLFFTGALARGLQQSSNLKQSFNPTVGVGAVINFGATTLEERWLNYIVSGWFMSGSIWTLFGSQIPQEIQILNKRRSHGK